MLRIIKLEPAAMPETSSFLEDEALAEWNRTAPFLYEYGRLDEDDVTALAEYCLTHQVFLKAYKALNKLRENPDTGDKELFRAIRITQRKQSEAVKLWERIVK